MQGGGEMISTSGMVLNNPRLSERIAELFDQLKGNEALQTEFINSPHALICDNTPTNVSELTSKHKVTKFIFDALKDESLNLWLKAHRAKSQIFESESSFRDLARIFIDFGSLKNAEGTALLPEIGFTVVHSISRTYVKTLNNSTTFFTKISIVVEPPQIQYDARTTMQIVSLAEQLLHASNIPQHALDEM